jgi:hypothetical protein
MKAVTVAFASAPSGKVSAACFSWYITLISIGGNCSLQCELTPDLDSLQPDVAAFIAKGAHANAKISSLLMVF